MTKNRFIEAFERDPTSVETLLGDIQILQLIEGDMMCFPLQAVMVSKEHDQAAAWTLDGSNCENPIFDLRIVTGVGGADWRDYAWLIDRVAMIDKKAARYLGGPATKLPHFQPNPNLELCFEWSDTPQGRHFWDGIYYELGERAEIDQVIDRIVEQAMNSEPEKQG